MFWHASTRVAVWHAASLVNIGHIAVHIGHIAPVGRHVSPWRIWLVAGCPTSLVRKLCLAFQVSQSRIKGCLLQNILGNFWPSYPFNEKTIETEILYAEQISKLYTRFFWAASNFQLTFTGGLVLNRFPTSRVKMVLSRCFF